MKTLGEKLRALRLEKNKTLTEVAEAIGVNKSAVSFWELDKNEPKASYIKKLAAYYEVSTDYLLGVESGDTSKA